MPSCVIKCCKNYHRKINRARGITYHTFPKREDLKKIWVKVVRHSRQEIDWNPSVGSTICSAHFDKADLRTMSSGRHYLRPSAVPKWLLSKTPVTQKQHSSMQQVALTNEYKSDECCRLCAGLQCNKLTSKFLNIQSDKNLNDLVLKMINRLNANIDFNQAHLPTTTCSDCLKKLYVAYDFIVGIDLAQDTLKKMLMQKNKYVAPENINLRNNMDLPGTSLQQVSPNINADSANSEHSMSLAPINRGPDLPVCKICLKISCRLFHIRALGLEDTYTTISGVPLEAKMFPQVICTICAVQLRKAMQLADKSKWAHTLLMDLYAKKNCGKITIDEVEQINCIPISEISKLSATHLAPNHFDLQINEDIVDVKLESEEDPKYSDHSYQNDDYEEKLDVSNEDDNLSDDIKPGIKAEMASSVELLNDHNEADTKENKINVDGCIVFKVVADKIENKSKPAITSKRLSRRTVVASRLQANVERKAKASKPKSEKADSSNKDANKEQRKKTSSPSSNTRKDQYGPILKEIFEIRKLNMEEQRLEHDKLRLTAMYVNSPYKCETCFRGFKVEIQYLAHMEKHKESFGEYECTQCRLRFPSLARRDSHLLKHKTLYACKKCSFKTMRKISARHHLNWHHGRVHKCDICPDLVFEFRTSLARHRRKYHPSQFFCVHCGRGCLDEKGLNSHLICQHQGMMNQISEGPSCNECNVTFASYDALATHQIAQHGDVDDSLANICRKVVKRLKRGLRLDRFECNQCSKVFSLRQHLSLHMRKVHGQRMPPQPKKPQKAVYCKQCDVCGKLFTCQATLRDHADEHSESASHECEQCGKSFKTRAKLTQHKAGHTQKYSCPVCLKNYSSSGNRDRHYQNVHIATNDVKCRFCTKCFKSTDRRRSHEVHVHMKKPWPKRNRDTKATSAIILATKNDVEDIVRASESS